MNKLQSRPALGRRDFLKLIAGASVTATGGYALFAYAPWLNYEEQANYARRPFEKDSTLSAQMQELVRYATLAANAHNSQPWKFAISGKVVEIHPDYSRRLRVVDPHERELWISLGCALENLLIAAQAAGYASHVTYPDAQEFIQVDLVEDKPPSNALLGAILVRQDTRSEYDGRLVTTTDLNQLQTSEPGVVLRYVTSSADLETVLEYVNQGNLSQYADKAFLDELIHWVRFTKKEATAMLDGLYAPCSGNPEVPRWLGQIVLAGTNPQQQADVDARKLRSSAGAVIIAAESDSKTAWVRTGQVYERMALQMTLLNIKSAFLNQPIEVAALRGQFQTALGLGDSLPQLLVRFGYAASMPRSLRRPVEQVIVNS